MARVKLRLKGTDQRPFTRFNPRACSIATAAKRVYGGTVTATDTLVIRRGGRTWTLRVGADGMAVEGTHDAGNRVGARAITLYGKPPPTLAEQAEAAKKAQDARVQARAARKAKATERAEAAAEKARTQPAERPDPRQQARTGARERPRSDEEAREQARARRAQEAEARERLRASSTEGARPAAARQDRAPRAAQPAVAEQARPASPPRAAEHATRQPRAIEPPKPALRWLLRNPFARPEPEREPAKSARAGAGIPAGRR